VRPDTRLRSHDPLTPGGRGPTLRAMLHACLGPGCGEQVRADRLACRPCWRQIPRPLRDVLWATWRSGQGVGSPEHRAAVADVVAALTMAGASR
jgi:hypothetical protein